MCPTRQDQRACPGAGSREELVTRPVNELEGLDQIFEDALPAFGGAQLRRVWQLLDEAIGRGIPMSLAVSGPVTLSGQAQTWLNPLLDTGWFFLISTTDAVCYHDGHRALDDAQAHPFFHVPIFGDDGGLRDERTIRVTDVGFDEDVLLEQDRFLRACLRQPEFQQPMSGPEFRNKLGARFAAQERHNEVAEGLLALCWRKAIPIFVGAPADGSVFLNSVDLWSRVETEGTPHRFELDLHREVFESCAFHRWGVKEHAAGALGTLILGGGVPKNFNLQPEPMLSQIFGFEDVPGYLYDIQITTAPVTDGSLSSCPPAEAVTWGKVDKDSYESTCTSMHGDYTAVMPFLVKALLDKRARFERWAERMGTEALFAKHPAAMGYLRDRVGARLMDRREELVTKLFAELAERGAGVPCDYPLAAPIDPATLAP
ncbi:MAG: deoxyhypusine synthase family protein [Planctomycetota bacterium]